jgi:OTU domain-containing protein 6
MFGANLAAGFGLGGGNGGGKKKSSRQKFEERQVGPLPLLPSRISTSLFAVDTRQARKQEALLNSAPPSDPAWTAQLEQERKDEIRVISEACEVLGREIFEVGSCFYYDR